MRKECEVDGFKVESLRSEKGMIVDKFCGDCNEEPNNHDLLN